MKMARAAAWLSTLSLVCISFDFVDVASAAKFASNRDVRSLGATAKEDAVPLGTVCPGSGKPATWIHAYSLRSSDIAAAGCPGNLMAKDVWSHEPGGAPRKACIRGQGVKADGTIDAQMFQKSAFVVRGYEYNAIRGNVGAYAMGSPDSFRSEPPRGKAGIDDM